MILHLIFLSDGRSRRRCFLCQLNTSSSRRSPFCFHLDNSQSTQETKLNYINFTAMFCSIARAIAAHHGHHHRLYSRGPQAGACSSRIRGLSSSSPASGDRLSYEIVPKEDFGEFQEFSIIFTNQALNLMSNPFQRVMRDLNALLKETYKADKVAIIPG